MNRGARQSEPAWQSKPSWFGRNRLALRLTLLTSVIALILAALYTTFEIQAQKQNLRAEASAELKSLGETVEPALSASLWELDTERAEIVLYGLLHAPGVDAARVTSIQGEAVNLGPELNRDNVVTIALSIQSPQNDDRLLGMAWLSRDLSSRKSALLDHSLASLAANVGRTLLIALFLLLLTHFLVIRRLQKIEDYTRTIDSKKLATPLKPTSSRNRAADSIDRLEEAIDSMRRKLLRDIRLRERNRKEIIIFANALASIAEGVVILDERYRLISMNASAERLLERSNKTSVGLSVQDIMGENLGPAFQALTKDALSTRQRWEGQLWIERANDEGFPALVSLSLVQHGPDNKNIILVFNDVSRYRQFEERMDFLRHHDALTSLPNRRFITRLLERRLSHGRLYPALLMLDLDDFKTVNNSLGHDAGDRLLQSVANRLQDAISGDDIIGRLGSDEFAIIHDTEEDNNSLPSICQAIESAMTRPFHIQGHEIHLSTCIGIARHPSDGQDANTLITRADAALYQSKLHGRSSHSVSQREIIESNKIRFRISADLRKAIERDELALYLQPIVKLSNSRITAMEGLIRWNHPEQGQISPGDFLPIAASSGLMPRLNEWVLDHACEILSQLPPDRPEGFRVAVNLSADAVHDRNLPHKIASCLAQMGLNPRLLEIEITETAVMKSQKLSRSVLEQLRELGVTVAMDDFGTGYSSLAYLRQFPLDYLKIDRSFVTGVPDVREDCGISQTIMTLADRLGIKTIVEGVETQRQRDFFRDHGCDEAQGFLFYRPMPAAEAGQLLKASAADEQQNIEIKEGHE